MIQYAIEADPGKLTASFPTFDTYDDALRAHGFLRGRGVPLGLADDWPRILTRRNGGPWRVRVSTEAVAVDRFDPDVPTTYRARSGGPLRATRQEAEVDERREPDLFDLFGDIA